VATVELFASGDVERSGESGGPGAAVVPNVSHPVTLLVVAPNAPNAAAVRLRFLDTSGTVLWETYDLTRQETGEYSVYLPAGALPAGGAVLRLESERDGEWAAVAAIALEISG
jgi:hypothetical protein